MRTSTRIETPPSPQPAILGFLMLGPRHPYELYQVFDAELGGVWRLGRSHLYAHLRQLADAGLAATHTERRGSRPARNIYSITPTGRSTFHAWVQRPSTHMRHMRLELLARLYFHRRLSLTGCNLLIAGQKRVLASRIAAARVEIKGTEDPFWRQVLRFRVCEMQAVSTWLDACREEA